MGHGCCIAHRVGIIHSHELHGHQLVQVSRRRRLSTRWRGG
jgi:hypothetical protein